MLRRVLCGVGVLGLVLLATACPAPYYPNPLPPGYEYLSLDSVAVSPEVVTAGETFTLTLTASGGTEPVSGVDVRFWPLHLDSNHTDVVPCVEEQFEPAMSVEVDIVCTMPAFATNGTWQFRAAVADGFADKAQYLSLEVVGGSGDISPPVIESVVTSPSPVVYGQPFAVTLRISDDHPLNPYPTIVGEGKPISIRGSGWTCTQFTQTTLSPALQEWRFDCPANATLAATPGAQTVHVIAGLTAPSQSYIEDAIGNRVTSRFLINVADAP